MRLASKAFGDWYERASVRDGPRRLVSKEDLQTGYCFSPALVPALEHPKVRERGESLKQKILVRALYRYLAFTEQLEHRVVNRAALRLAQNETAVSIPSPMRLDAYRLCCDEAYHALFCADLVDQLEVTTGVPQPTGATSSFIAPLEAQIAAADANDRELARLFFAVVSETLITRALVQIPRDLRVIEPVRQIVLDHARDESRHNVYFSGVFAWFWERLERRTQVRMGTLLPRFILLFLASDPEPVITALKLEGMLPEEIEQVVRESSVVDQDRRQVRAAAASSLQLFERLGLFEIPAIHDAFAREMLLAPQKVRDEICAP